MNQYPPSESSPPIHFSSLISTFLPRRNVIPNQSSFPFSRLKPSMLTGIRHPTDPPSHPSQNSVFRHSPLTFPPTVHVPSPNPSTSVPPITLNKKPILTLVRSPYRIVHSTPSPLCLRPKKLPGSPVKSLQFLSPGFYPRRSSE